MFIRFALLALLAFHAPLVAQTAPDRFANGLGRFSIEATGKPERSEVSSNFEDYQLIGESFVWNSDKQFLEVQAYVVYGDVARPSAAQKRKIVADLAASFASDMEATGASVQRRQFADGATTGVEMRMTSSIRMLARAFFMGTRVYLVAVSNEGKSFEEMTVAFKSLRTLTKAEQMAALIADATPAPLPQTGADPAYKGEAKHEGLRGSVRSVVTERQEGNRSTRVRKMETYYSKDGYTEKEIVYDEGYPTLVSVYGWIDGKRVSASEPIQYGPDEGPAIKELVAMMDVTDAGPIPATAPKPAKDERFSFSYLYSYGANGELVERSVLANDGSLEWRTTVAYGKGQREQTEYTSEGTLDERFVEILDAEGNVVEDRKLDSQGRLERNLVYSRIFDTKGNWTVSKEYKKVRGKKSTVPAAVTYRTITYH